MKTLSIRITVYFFSFLISIGNIYAQQFQWVRGGGSVASTTEQVNFMCTDPNGNVYVLSTVGNDPIVADTFHATPYGGTNNTLLTSYTCNGQMRWAKLISSSGTDCTPYGIAADSLGHIYVAGIYYEGGGTTYVGHDTAISGPATQYLVQGLIEFDTSGHFNWIRYVGNNTLATGLGTGNLYNPITVDGANNVHYLCCVKAGVVLMTGVTSVHGVYDLTYNPGGTLLSAVHLVLGSQWFVRGAVIDPATNKLYTWGEVDQSSGATDTFFAAAFDASRNLLWQYFAGYGDDDGISGITLDQSKHLYFSGGAQPLSGETRFVFNGDSVLAPYDVLSILMKTDTNGNVDWMRANGCHLSVNGFHGITLLPNNKVASVGTFASKLYFGTDSLTVPSVDGYSPYIAIFDSAGDLQAIPQIFGDGFYNQGTVITSDKVGNVYVGGYVADSIWAGTPAIPAYHSIGGNTDFFVMKYGVPCSCISMPVASYTDTGTHTVGFTYTGTSSGIDSVRWSFGDGGTSTLTNPIYTYTASGTYQVCVSIYSGCGNDSFCTNITVGCVVPTSGYSHTGVPGVNFTYTGTTSGIDSVVWHYGDGGRGTGLTPAHTYTALGTYTVCATAYTNCDSNTYCDTLVIGTLNATLLHNTCVRVFPNPVGNELYITGVLQNTSYRLLNVTGGLMQEGVLNRGSNAISIKNFAAGIYILEMTDADGERNMVRVVKE